MARKRPSARRWRRRCGRNAERRRAVAVSNFELARRVAALPPTISGTERLLLHTLILHRNARTGECFPTYPTLAREMGASVRTVKYATARLAAARLLTVGKRKTRDGDGNTYALTLPAIHADGATVAPSDGATVAHTTADRRCNPQPQTVQSTTADGATVAPEQRRNSFQQRTNANAVAPAPRVVAISKAVVLDAAERLGIPRRFAEETADLWEATNWETTGGIPISPRNVETLIRRWWENCDNPSCYENWYYHH